MEQETDDPVPLDGERTMDLRDALGIVGPRVLSAPAGAIVRDRWALASSDLEDGVAVEWVSDGAVVSQRGLVVAIEFGIDGARSGDTLQREIRAILRGPDWKLELPSLALEIRVL